MADTLVATIAGLAIGIAFLISFSMSSIQSKTENSSSVIQEDNQVGRSALLLINGCAAPTQRASENLLPIKERTWISVSRLELQPYLIGRNTTCSAATPSLLSDLPKLESAINGAEGCDSGTEVCQISYGMSSATIYPNGIAVDDSMDYELSLSRQEATTLASRLDLKENLSILAHNNKFYLLAFHTTDANDSGTQVETKIENPIDWHPISLEQGESISFDILVRTWATYGGQVEITMEAYPSARDSGLVVKLEPNVLTMDERSEAKVKLTVSAPKDKDSASVKPGTYETYVTGRINNSSLLPSPCDLEGQCPVIQVGDSRWTISTFGSDSSMWMGGKEPPEWLSAEITTSKASYQAGENVTVGAYLVNKGDQEVTLENPRMFLLIFGSEKKDGYGNVYGYDASLDGSVTIRPDSRMLLAREFGWDQKTFSNGVEPTSVQQGIYRIELALSGLEGHVFYDNKEIEIGSDELDDHSGTDSMNETIPKDHRFKVTTILILSGASEIPETNSTFFEPRIASVNLGDKFQWDNQDYVPHTATSSTPALDDAGQLFDTKIILPRHASDLYSIDRPGEYQYFCVLHPWMGGTIIIESG